jgi:predicted MFS family arabinose efflux permease
VGIVYSGLACLALSQAHRSSTSAWAVLGASAFAVTALTWPVFDDHAGSTTKREQDSSAGALGLASHWRLVYAHGAFGFGYIIPATFLPVMAKQAIADAAVFGWAWPVFGAAAAISTSISGRLASRYTPRRLWAFGLFVMALGVTLPVFVTSLSGIIVSALAVGGTFMVVTMVGMQEARREAGAAARTLIGAMTAAFAAGQIAGPLVVGALAHVENGFAYALFAAAAPLMLAAWLLGEREPAPGTTPSRNMERS